MPLPDPSLPDVGTDVDTPGSEVRADESNKTMPIIDSLIKAAEDITNVEIQATNGLVKIAQMRAKAMTMPVLVEFSKGLLQHKYDQLPGDLLEHIKEYLAKLAEPEVTDLEAVNAYGLELHIKSEALRNAAQVLEPSLGRDAVNILRIFGLL